MGLSIIPVPVKIEEKPGFFILKGTVRICGTADSFNNIFLTELLTKYACTQTEEADKDISWQTDQQLVNEAYSLSVSEDEIIIRTAGKAGEFYALITLAQLFCAGPHIPCGTISDQPRYEYRGFLLDVCRHFIPKAEVLRLVDIIAALKLNQLHLHLTDDQGWRIEIEKYPLLTQIGSVRNGSPFYDYQEDTADYHNNGFFTKADMREIIVYAAERNIEIIPEIDMPGHMTAATAAYRELLCKPHEVKVAEKAGIFGNIPCMGKESVYCFLTDVLQEIFDLFPGKTVHLGGDEVLKSNWLTCDDCMEAAKQNHLTAPHQMQTLFMNQLIAFAKRCGKKVILWNDAFSDKTIDSAAICQFWNAFGKLSDIQLNALENKTEMIDSNVAAFYFDYPIEAVPLPITYAYESVFTEVLCHLKGLECALWTESVCTKKILNERLFPRLYAFAESAWSPMERKNYTDFRARLLANLSYFEQFGITTTDCRRWENSRFQSKLAYFKHIRRMISWHIIKTMVQIRKINRMQEN